MTRASARLRRRRGSDRLRWAGPAVGATFLTGVAGAVARSQVAYPRPGASAEDIHRYFAQPSGAPWISVAGQLLSAASLAAWTARITRLADGSRALQAMAITGGAISSVALTTSAGCAATLTLLPEPSARTVRLHRAAFLSGGPTHGAGFGLQLIALGLAGRRARLLPAPLTRAALLAAAPNLLAPAYLVWPRAAWLIPAGRFPGLIVTALAATRLA